MTRTAKINVVITIVASFVLGTFAGSWATERKYERQARLEAQKRPLVLPKIVGN